MGKTAKPGKGKKRTGPQTKPALSLLLVVVIGFFCYCNTLHSPFQLDDNTFFLKGNSIIKDLHYFIEPSRAKVFRQYDGFISRYIGYLSFAIDYKMHGLEVTGYHIVNLLIHIVNALLVYFFVLITFRTPFFRQWGRSVYGPRVALFSALLFVSHPVQTEAVTYIFQRLASLVTLFYLLSLVLYIKARLLADDAEGRKRVKVFALYALSVASAALAMKTKENAFTLPIAAALYEFLFFDGPVKKRVAGLVPLLLTLIIIPYTLLRIRAAAGLVVNSQASQGASAVTATDYLLTQFRVIVTYIRLLFLPVNQNVDYNFPLYHSLSAPPVFMSLLFIGALVSAALYLIRFSGRRGDPLCRFIGFGIIWFFLTLSVESSIVPIPRLLCEYRVYLPSAGALPAMTAALFAVADRFRKRFAAIDRTTVAALAIITLVFSGLAYARNLAWSDEVSLWEDSTRKDPGNGYAHFALGGIYAQRGRFDDALGQYRTAIALNPGDAPAHNDLGLVYLKQGRAGLALQEFQTALSLRPDYIETHTNLGAIYFNQGRFDEAVRQFRAVTALQPDSVEAHIDLGAAYFKQGLLDDAVRQYRAALDLRPDFVEAHYNLGLAYSSQGRLPEAVKEFQAVLALEPGSAAARAALQNIFMKK